MHTFSILHWRGKYFYYVSLPSSGSQTLLGEKSANVDASNIRFNVKATFYKELLLLTQAIIF